MKFTRDNFTSPRGRFFSSKEEIVDNFNSPRKKAREIHVYPLTPMFPKGGPISSRYRMKFTINNFTSPRGRFFSSKKKIADNFTSPRNLAGERYVSPTIPVFLRGRPSSPREELAKKEKSARCIIPHVVSPGQRWHVVNHKKFPQRLSRTQKRRM